MPCGLSVDNFPTLCNFVNEQYDNAFVKLTECMKIFDDNKFIELINSFKFANAKQSKNNSEETTVVTTNIDGHIDAIAKEIISTPVDEHTYITDKEMT